MPLIALEGGVDARAFRVSALGDVDRSSEGCLPREGDAAGFLTGVDIIEGWSMS